MESKARFGAGETPIAYLSGDSEAAILFAEGSIPYQFSICSLSRYTGDQKHAILQAHHSHTGAEWFHGHSNGNAGVVYYGLYKTLPKSSLPVHDWVVVCSQNKKIGVTLLNGMEAVLAQNPGQAGGDGELQLVVNSMMPGTQKSDW